MEMEAVLLTPAELLMLLETVKNATIEISFLG